MQILQNFFRQPACVYDIARSTALKRPREGFWCASTGTLHRTLIQALIYLQVVKFRQGWTKHYAVIAQQRAVRFNLVRAWWFPL
jgi:hypothetical protein